VLDNLVVIGIGVTSIVIVDGTGDIDNDFDTASTGEPARSPRPHRGSRRTPSALRYGRTCWSPRSVTACCCGAVACP